MVSFDSINYAAQSFAGDYVPWILSTTMTLMIQTRKGLTRKTTGNEIDLSLRRHKVFSWLYTLDRHPFSGVNDAFETIVCVCVEYGGIRMVSSE